MYRVDFHNQMKQGFSVRARTPERAAEKFLAERRNDPLMRRGCSKNPPVIDETTGRAVGRVNDFTL